MLTSRSSVSILLALLKPIVKVKISVDGKQVFEHPRFEDLDEIEVGKDAALYDMEKYQLPPLIRKILKTTKLQEIFEVRCKRKDKVITAFEDPNGIFTNSLVESMESEVTYTVNLVAFEQKDYLFKLLIEDKLARLTFMKGVATDFFKAGNLRKAEKVYGKVHSYFRTKDAKNNFQS
jgi:tetratricopeptide (TPR) repeat protein